MGARGIESIKIKIELSNPWQVVLYNDEAHTFDEVIFQIQKATGYSLERATQITLLVHERGRAIAFVGDKEPSQKVATILKEILLKVEVEKT